MKRTPSLATLALTLTLLAPTAARAAFAPPVPPEGPAGARRMAAERVVPRSFNFSDLPRVAPGGERTPVTLRPEHEGQEPAEEVQRLKAFPPLLPTPSFAQFTLDTTAPGASGKGAFSPLAPTLANRFEGITQNGFIPSDHPLGGRPLTNLSC